MQENGFDVNTYSGKKKIFGSLALVVGDNPASSAIGGFKESSSAYRPCRHCMATTEEIKNQVYMYIWCKSTLQLYKCMQILYRFCVQASI